MNPVYKDNVNSENGSIDALKFTKSAVDLGFLVS